MHNMGKTISELHAMLIEYEKGLPKKAETPQVMMIKGGEIHKSNKKSLKAKGKGKSNGKGKDKQVYIPKPKNPKPAAKEHPAKDDTYHHCKELTSPYTTQHNGVSERINCTLLDMVRSLMNITTLPLSFWDYALDSATRILNMVPTKKVDKTPYEIWIPKGNNGLLFLLPPENKIVVVRYAEFFKKNLITQEVSGRAIDLEKIQNEDTSPPEITSEIPIEVKGFEPPQKEVIPIRRAIRILISIAVYDDYEIWKIDVKISFLNGYLDEDIYMVQHEGFVDPNHPRKASGSNVTFLILYVDDIIIMRNHIPSLQSLKDYLGKCFAMKDLGKAAFILGIKIYRDRSKRLIGLGQNAYMDKILKRYKMNNSKHGHIPMQERLDLNKTQGASTPKEVKRMQNVPYASAVGSIIYAVRCTRPDVAFAQNITSWFQQNPDRICLYFEWRRNGLEKLQAKYYCNVCLEAEYIAALKAAMEAVWIRKFISGLGIVPTINEPI
uniref:Reverse transcriptase Ty1/copia-type domain-containing protein n=1 Tax=Tanacetum cinerariifolium TaxID=118510 RepID=A0A6L2MEV5_TANCI|nr:hypothetical protein [Tanacetum cinerariifolium]